MSARGAVPLIAGLGGSVALGGCVVAAALAYRGTQGEPYSPFSHWISELGEVGVSELAPVFNGGVVIGGLCLSALMLSLARARRGGLARTYGLLGAAAGVAGALAGVFPMNRVIPHGIAASSFFGLAALAIGLASADFAGRPDHRFGRRQGALGAASSGVVVAFVLTATYAIWNEGIEALEPPADRGAISALTSLEWASLILIVVWVAMTALAWSNPR